MYLVGKSDDLVIYAVGPGFGESIVVREPCGDVVVVDACKKAGSNLTAELLERLAASRVSLLVLSHPDTDHVRGATEVLQRFDPDTIWTYPLAVSLRTHLSRIAAEDPEFTATGLPDLQTFLDALEPYRERNIAQDVQSNTASWRSSGGDLEVYALAPTQADIDRADKGVRAILRNRAGQVAVSPRIEAFLRGRTAEVGDHPNLLSVGLSLCWRGRRLLLGGDVESGATAYSGWRGTIEILTRTGRLQRIQGIGVAKVAHHGSDNAYWDDAWKEHARFSAELVAVICPFNKSGELPAQRALSGMHAHAATLAITHATPVLNARTRAAGWKVSTSATSQRDWDLPVAAVVVPATGPLEVHAAAGGGVWKA